MQRAACLVSLLVLQGAGGLQADTQTPVIAQENFDLDQFLGRWYEVAVVSTCPHHMRDKRGNPVIVALDVTTAAPQGNLTVAAAFLRNGTCKQTSTHYGLTNTSGRFFHHVPRFDADVDSYVVQTNYDEYAMMVQLSTERPSGQKTTIVRLYSRTVDVTSALLEDFKSLVGRHGVNEDAIIINENKGECVPGEEVSANIPPSQTSN